jgi:hypothetical protein
MVGQYRGVWFATDFDEGCHVVDRILDISQMLLCINHLLQTPLKGLCLLDTVNS